MSLEAKIEALTAAVVANTAAVLSSRAPTPEQAVKASADKPTAPAEPLKTAAQEQATKREEAANPVTYDTVKTPFLALVKKNRDLALATLKPFGLDSLKGAKPEQLGAILDAVNKALAA